MPSISVCAHAYTHTYMHTHTYTQLVCLGLSHHSAPVIIREKLAIPEDKWLDVGREISKLPGVNEAAVISTCNRFEIYFAADNAFDGARQVTEYLHR